MNRKDLLNAELEIFVNKIKSGYNPQKIILFGSLANGQINDESDLDLVVIKKTTEDFWSRLKSISKYCSHNIGMDVLVYTPEEFDKLSKTRTFFIKEISNKGKVLYDKAQSS